MKRLWSQITLALGLIGLFLGGLGHPVWAQSFSRPVVMGAQWFERPPGVIVNACQDPNEGGASCIFFPRGGTLYGISWNSSVKNNGEVAYALEVATTGPIFRLVVTHQFGAQCGTVPCTLIREIHLSRPVHIPSGASVYIVAAGFHLDGSGGISIEAQVTLWVDALDEAFLLWPK